MLNQQPDKVEIQHVIITPNMPTVQVNYRNLQKRVVDGEETLVSLGNGILQMTRDEAEQVLGMAPVGATVGEVLMNAMKAALDTQDVIQETAFQREKARREKDAVPALEKLDGLYRERRDLKDRLAKFESLDWKNAPRDLQLFANAMGLLADSEITPEEKQGGALSGFFNWITGRK